MPRKLKVIIAGAGRVGEQTASRLREYGHEITIVEADEARCEELSHRFLAMIICGDAAAEGILPQARPERHDVVAALTNRGAVNRRICEIARERNPGIRTVARIEKGDEPPPRPDAVVDEVVDPVALSAVGAVNAVMGGSVRALQSLPGIIRILLIEVADDAPGAGKRIDQVSLPTGALVVSAAEGGEIAGPATELQPGQRYIVAAETGVAEEVMRLFHG